MDSNLESMRTGKIKIERLVDPVLTSDDQSTVKSEVKLRPTRFSEYPGQESATANLKVYVEAAKRRQSSIDHILLHGPPGLGKTTLAMIIANELGVAYTQTSGPCIEKAGDLAGILAGLEAGSVLFIDEIHRLPIHVEEVLYSAMEDFYIDIMIGQGTAARSVRMPLQPFTLIGATTRISLLSAPLLSRFGIQERLEFYSSASLQTIIQRSASIEGVSITEDGALALAERSRGTPRVANRLLRRVCDFALVSGDTKVSKARVEQALLRLKIDSSGLDPMDRKILTCILDRYDGGPVGIETLAHTVGEDRATIEEVYEPFLVHNGFISRGPRGRELTIKARDHLQRTQE